MAEFFSKMLNPFGPIITPDIIKPIIPGILIRLSKIGESKMINKIRENTKTGLLKGNSKFFSNPVRELIIDIKIQVINKMK